MIRSFTLASLSLTAALFAPAQCGPSDRAASAPVSQPATPAQRPATAPDSLIATARPNPCAFPAYAVERLLGPLDGPIWLAKSMSDTTFAGKNDDSHWACMIRLAPRPGVPKGSIVAFEILTDAAIAFETGAAAMNKSAKNMLDLIGAKTADGAQHGVDGWDYLGAYPREMTGRVGHIAIHVDWGGVAVPIDSIERLMVLQRDELPDVPIFAGGPGSEAGDEDPCSLITRKEAESILGPLSARPYESRDLSGLVDDHGTGCSYYTKNHRVLSVRPWWSHGKAVFNVIGATRPMPTAGVAPDPSAWDKQAADLVGNLYFLKGDRLLAVSWKTSSTDAEGAVKIAALAMKKLAQ